MEFSTHSLTYNSISIHNEINSIVLKLSSASMMSYHMKQTVLQLQNL